MSGYFYEPTMTRSPICLFFACASLVIRHNRLSYCDSSGEELPCAFRYSNRRVSDECSFLPCELKSKPMNMMLFLFSICFYSSHLLQIFEQQSWDSQVAYLMVKQDCLFHVDIFLLTWMKYVNV